MEYITNRLASQTGTAKLASWFGSTFSSLKVIPRFLIPRYFDSVIMAANEALNIHVTGLKFRERNAGVKMDKHMKYEGFINEIGVDADTGFVFGRNKGDPT